jgi:thioredoxin 1
MSDKLKALNTENFQQAISDGVTLVDFWAPWCGPCKMQTPILEQVAEQVDGQATVAKLNVDDAPQVAGQFGVQSIPTLIVFRDGERVEQFVGLQQADTLVDAIESAAGAEEVEESA